MLAIQKKHTPCKNLTKGTKKDEKSHAKHTGKEGEEGDGKLKSPICLPSPLIRWCQFHTAFDSQN